MSDASKLELKNLPHDVLIKLVRGYAPPISEEGVCNGTTSMWIQAISVGDLKVKHFYDRFDIISTYLSRPNHNVESLKVEIDDLYTSQKKPSVETGRERETLSVEQFDKMELRPFAESVAIQQKPEVLGIFEENISQDDKERLLSITAPLESEQGLELCLMSELPENQEPKVGSVYVKKVKNRIEYIFLSREGEKIEGSFELSPDMMKAVQDELIKEFLPVLKPYILRQVLKTKSAPIGVVGLTLLELEHYLNNMKAVLEKDHEVHPGQRSCFLLGSDNHAVGLYFDALLKKWHFFDINQLSGKVEYYFLVNSAELAPIIFNSFFDKKEGNTVFTVNYFSTHDAEDLISSLRTVTHACLPGAVKKVNARDRSVLELAASHGFVEAVDILLAEQGCDVNAVNKSGFTALMLAASRGHRDIVERLLVVPGISLEAERKAGMTPLMFAASGGHPETVKRLLAVSAISLMAKSNTGNTALMLAARAGHVAVISTLLSEMQLNTTRTFDVNTKNIEGKTALMLAAENGKSVAVRALLDFPDIGVHEIDKHGNTALKLAVEKDHMAVALVLLSAVQRHPDTFNVEDYETLFRVAVNKNQPEIVKALLPYKDAKAALMLAVESGHVAVVSVLIAAALANPELHFDVLAALRLAIKNRNGEMVEKLLSAPGLNVESLDSHERVIVDHLSLELAALRGDLGAIKTLVDLPRIDVNIGNRNGWTPLMLAAAKGHLEVVKALLDVPEIRVNEKNHDNQTALMVAVASGHSETVQKLLAVSDIETNINDKRGNTLMMLAAEAGHAGIILDWCALAKENPKFHFDVNVGNHLGMTALMLAAKNNRSEAVKALLDVPGIQVNDKDMRGKTALMLAIEGGHLAVISVLFAADPKLNLDVKMALIWATEKNKPEVVKALLAFPGIDLSTKNKDGKTALMLAAEQGHVASLAVLLSPDSNPQFSKLQIDERDEEYSTALILAAEHGKREAVKALLDFPGIKLDTANIHGKTALMLAAEQGDVEMVSILLAAVDPEFVNEFINEEDENGKTAIMLAEEHKEERSHSAIIDIIQKYSMPKQQAEPITYSKDAALLRKKSLSEESQDSGVTIHYQEPKSKPKS